MVAIVIAAIGGRAVGVRAIFLLGIWSILYGSQRFDWCSTLLALEPHWMQVGAHYMRAATTRLRIPHMRNSFGGGDCFLFFTDGRSEPENAAGEPFADKVEQLLRENQFRLAAELSLLLVNAVRAGLLPPLRSRTTLPFLSSMCCEETTQALGAHPLARPC